MSSAEYGKMWREKMRNSYRCTGCGTQDSRTLAGFSKCRKCTDKYKKTSKKLLGKCSDINSVVRLANAEGVSYGFYMAKYFSD